MARCKERVIPDAILDQLLASADAKTAFDPNGLLDQLKKALTKRAWIRFHHGYLPNRRCFILPSSATTSGQRAGVTCELC